MKTSRLQSACMGFNVKCLTKMGEGIVQEIKIKAVVLGIDMEH